MAQAQREGRSHTHSPIHNRMHVPSAGAAVLAAVDPALGMSMHMRQVIHILCAGHSMLFIILNHPHAGSTRKAITYFYMSFKGVQKRLHMLCSLLASKVSKGNLSPLSFLRIEICRKF